MVLLDDSDFGSVLGETFRFLRSTSVNAGNEATSGTRVADID